MSGKQLDWGAIANVNFDDKRRKTLGIQTGREAFAKAYENMAKAEAAMSKRAESEPILKAGLIEKMVNRQPILVMQPINNPTEAIPGLEKSNSEDDDGFYNTSPSMSAERTANAKFEEVMEVIPRGTELVYKSWDKQMGQWIFKGSNGKEYAIYDKSVIIYKGSAIENPGFYGLLFSTNLVDLLGD